MMRTTALVVIVLLGACLAEAEAGGRGEGGQLGQITKGVQVAQ